MVGFIENKPFAKMLFKKREIVARHFSLQNYFLAKYTILSN
jgi:hypothetical protein